MSQSLTRLNDLIHRLDFLWWTPASFLWWHCHSQPIANCLSLFVTNTVLKCANDFLKENNSGLCVKEAGMIKYLQLISGAWG